MTFNKDNTFENAPFIGHCFRIQISAKLYWTIILLWFLNPSTEIKSQNTTRGNQPVITVRFRQMSMALSH
jgi:hypothetical protein